MSNDLISAFQKILTTRQILTGENVKERSHHVWLMDQPLQAKAVLLPTSTKEVSAILSICHQQNQPVVIHGGLTNLVGSTETDPNEVVISMEKMNHIEEIDPQSRTMTVQAGVILHNIQQKAAENELFFPLNFGAKGSAQIGGIIGTNAGGLRVFRYGMTRNLILGLEVVLADGTIITSLKKIIKDNSGYDLKQLFIGSEGTLGVVTRAVVKLVEAPRSRVTALAGLETYAKVVEFLKFMDAGMAGTLSAFEILWPAFYQAMTSEPALVTPPLPYQHDYYVLLEGLGSDQAQDQARLIHLLEKAMKKGIITDATPAQSGAETASFWRIREDVDIMGLYCKNPQYFDISLPIPLIGEVVEKMVEELYALPEVEKVFYFGHLADGNIHLVVGKNTQNEKLVKQINEITYHPLKAIGGSVSAEHGIGMHKKPYLSISRNPEEIALMKILKKTLDPKGILNRGKVVD